MKDKIDTLYRRFLNQEATDEEIAHLLDFFGTASTQELHQRVQDAWQTTSETPVRPHSDATTREVYRSIVARIQGQRKTPPLSVPAKRFSPQWLSAAAVLLLALLLGYGGWKVYQKDKLKATKAATILPGTHRATLTMTNGNSIDLSSEQSGIVVGKGVTYLDGSQVLPSPEKGNNGSVNPKSAWVVQNAVLATPRGGMYQITLSDGTKAWLNAASTLTYPAQFNGKERVVELTGEAYFEVEHLEDAQGKRIPFLVKTAQQTVEVLGTRFNITAYPEEPDTRTTLLEGSVRLHTVAGDAMTLIPGEEARLLRQKLSKYTVDEERAAAWKEGYFVLNDYNVKTFMRQLARWYNIEIEYDGIVPNRTLSGKISRNATLANVIEILRYFDLDCRVNERTLIVGSMVKPLNE